MANDNKQPERPTFDEVVNKVAEINYHHNFLVKNIDSLGGAFEEYLKYMGHFDNFKNHMEKIQKNVKLKEEQRKHAKTEQKNEDSPVSSKEVRHEKNAGK